MASKETAKGEQDFNLDVAYQNFLQRAGHLSLVWRIDQRLGIESAYDHLLSLSYLAQRVIRTSIYDSSWSLSHPGIFAALRNPLLSWQVRRMDKHDRLKRKLLARVDEEMQSFVEENSPTAEERRRARTIELAINDLVVQATSGNKDASVKFSLSEEQLNGWANYWRPQLSPA